MIERIKTKDELPPEKRQDYLCWEAGACGGENGFECKILKWRLGIENPQKDKFVQKWGFYSIETDSEGIHCWKKHDPIAWADIDHYPQEWARKSVTPRINPGA